jgi:hypothetical protein
MIVFDQNLENELLEVLKSRPKKLEEITLPSAPMPMVMGQPNPHAIEALKRRLTQLAEQGYVEMEFQDHTNMTGTKKFHAATGAWKITPKGLSEVIRRRKIELGYKVD